MVGFTVAHDWSTVEPADACDTECSALEVKKVFLHGDIGFRPGRDVWMAECRDRIVGRVGWGILRARTRSEMWKARIVPAPRRMECDPLLRLILLEAYIKSCQRTEWK